MRNLPGFERLYLLRDPLSKRALRGQIDGKIATLALTRGEVETSAPVQVRNSHHLVAAK